MARWEPNASDRLASAALELFAERGYDATSVADIAAAANLTKTTFFRHFRDKREVLFGGGAIDRLLIDAVRDAPPAATIMECVDAAIIAAAAVIFVPERRRFIGRRQSVIAAHPELQERDALKASRLVSAVSDALLARGFPRVAALTASQLTSLAMTVATEQWVKDPRGSSFTDVARSCVAEITAVDLRKTRAP